MADPRLFEDDPLLETPSEKTADGEPIALGGVLWGIGAIAAVVAAYFAITSLTRQSDALTLTGPQVAELQAGATVTLDGVPVGKVDQVTTRDGIPEARLQVDPAARKRVEDAGHFEVGSLNRILPGNVGVKVTSKSTPLNPSDKSAATRSSIRERLADPSILPARTPLGFYVALFVIVLLGIVLLGAALKVIRSMSFWVVVAIAVLIVAGQAWRTGKLDEATRWGSDQARQVGVQR